MHIEKAMLITHEMKKVFFRPFCNEEEIERILHPRNAIDYLLKLRAETIADHMRLFRVYRNKALSFGEGWSLEGSFDNTHYKFVLDRLPEPERVQCQQITYGDLFSNEPNGSILKTELGAIVTISESLKLFLEFMHLGLMNFGDRVPDHVKLNAIRIGIRVMLQNEALDFLMNPRGIIPPDINRRMRKPLLHQMSFIAGHEFAHYLLGHLSDSSVTQKPLYYVILNEEQEYKFETLYSQSQQQEFDADLKAVQILLNTSSSEKIEIIDDILLWFLCLELYEAIHEFWSPPSSKIIISHPTARDRLESIINNIAVQNGIDRSSFRLNYQSIDMIKTFLIEDVAVNTGLYEMYGSVYLDKPNTIWRGKELIDRVDYY